MRVAVWCASPLGERTARVLAADPSVDEVTIVADNRSASHPAIAPSELPGWDLLATDRPLPKDWPRPRRLVSTAEGHEPDDQGQVSGATIRSGIGGSLLALELGRTTRPTRVVMASTRTGPVLSRGERIRFPAPVGVLRARPDGRFSLPARVDQSLEAPSPGPWAGILIRISGSTTRLVGVADDRLFLSAVALAAAAVAAARGAYPEGSVFAYEAPEAFMEAAVGSGLTVASYSSEP